MTRRHHGPGPSDPDPELIAAFLDGTATEEERDEVVRRAARDPAWRELLAESYRSLAELGDEDVDPAAGPELDDEETVSELVLPGTSRLLLGLAAVALLGVALAFFLPQLRRDPLASEVLGAALVANDPLPDRWYDAEAFPRVRGEGSAAVSAADPSTAFQLGARSVEIEIAARRADREAARFLAYRIAELCAGDPALAGCQTVFELVAAEPEQLWDPSFGSPSDHAAAEPVVAFRLGSWAEASRIAASVDDREFFRTRSWTAGLALLERLLTEPENRTARRLRDLSDGAATTEIAAELSRLIRGVADRSVRLDLGREAEPAARIE